MSDHEFNTDFCKEDVHGWFSLTYSNYFVIPRSILQSMSSEWQHKFVGLMDEATELYGGYDMTYTVHKRDERGRFVSDPLSNYERGRRVVEPKPYDWAGDAKD
jgi:hypothetical protein